MRSYVLVFLAAIVVLSAYAHAHTRMYVHEHEGVKGYIRYFHPDKDNLVVVTRLRQLETEMGLSKISMVFHYPSDAKVTVRFEVKRDGKVDEKSSKTRSFETRAGRIHPITITERTPKLSPDGVRTLHVNFGNRMYFWVAKSKGQKGGGSTGYDAGNLVAGQEYKVIELTGRGGEAFELNIFLTVEEEVEEPEGEKKKGK